MSTVRACVTFYAHGRSVLAGDELDSSDPIVKGREHLFEGDSAPAAVVEQATAAPGEKRATRSRSTKSKG